MRIPIIGRLLKRDSEEKLSRKLQKTASQLESVLNTDNNLPENQSRANWLQRELFYMGIYTSRPFFTQKRIEDTYQLIQRVAVYLSTSKYAKRASERPYEFRQEAKSGITYRKTIEEIRRMTEESMTHSFK